MLPLKEYIKNPRMTVVVLVKHYGQWLPDSLYLKIIFRMQMGYRLNLRHPKTFSEKLQWLKLYNQRPEYTMMVDKYAVKEYVAGIIGGEYVIPTYGVWDKPEDIEWDKLPAQFVLKTTNGSGSDGVLICKDKSLLTHQIAIEKLSRSFKGNVFHSLREWPYKNVPHRIIAEKYMVEESGELRDYKFFCFDGCVKCIQVDYDRFTEHHRNVFDTDWNLLPFSIRYPSKKNVVISKPKNFDVMLKIAECLSKDIPHVRVDLYNINGKVYFGELTFFHGSGYEFFDPNEWDYKFGSWIKLPKDKYIENK